MELFLEITLLEILLKSLLASQNLKSIREKLILIPIQKNWKFNISMNKVYCCNNSVPICVDFWSRDASNGTSNPGTDEGDLFQVRTRESGLWTKLKKIKK